MGKQDWGVLIFLALVLAVSLYLRLVK
jgi:hypothetical protein